MFKVQEFVPVIGSSRPKDAATNVAAATGNSGATITDVHKSVEELRAKGVVSTVEMHYSMMKQQASWESIFVMLKRTRQVCSSSYFTEAIDRYLLEQSVGGNAFVKEQYAKTRKFWRADRQDKMSWLAELVFDEIHKEILERHGGDPRVHEWAFTASIVKGWRGQALFEQQKAKEDQRWADMDFYKAVLEMLDNDFKRMLFNELCKTRKSDAAKARDLIDFRAQTARKVKAQKLIIIRNK